MGWFQGVVTWLRRLGGGGGVGSAAGTSTASAGTASPTSVGTSGSSAGGRVRGEPASGNGASSFHLFWQLPGEFVAVRATLEIVQPPSVDRLYFWALQAGFGGGGRRAGAGHLGLQAHPQHPGGTAVNWGGYDETGRVLGGTGSTLTSALGNVNTRDFAWQPRRRYRLAIEAAPPDERLDTPLDPGISAWRGSVTDLASGVTTVVRELLTRGSRLVDPMVWSEVFARCEHPAVEVRWSDLEAETPSGERVGPTAVTVNYQADRDGGCANTNSWLDGAALVQRTATARTTLQGARIDLPIAPG